MRLADRHIEQGLSENKILHYYIITVSIDARIASATQGVDTVVCHFYIPLKFNGTLGSEPSIAMT